MYLKIKGETDLSLSCRGNQDKNCVAQVSWGTETGRSSRIKAIPGAISFSLCPHLCPLLLLPLPAYWLPLLSLSPGLSWLSIKCLLQYQGLYHLKNPEPWPSDPFHGLNYSVLWERMALDCLLLGQVFALWSDSYGSGWSSEEGVSGCFQGFTLIPKICLYSRFSSHVISFNLSLSKCWWDAIGT